MTEVVKPKRGRPPLDREVKHQPKPSLKMRSKPNWEQMDPNASDSPDKFHIDPSLIPPGMAAQWVTDSVLGKPMPQHRAVFEKAGWTSSHQDDFDGQLNGLFMPRDADGEIRQEGTVLMMRPKELSDRAKAIDMRNAREQVQIKEQALRGGDLNTSLDSQHPSAINSNRINKSYERIAIPED